MCGTHHGNLANTKSQPELKGEKTQLETLEQRVHLMLGVSCVTDKSLNEDKLVETHTAENRSLCTESQLNGIPGI